MNNYTIILIVLLSISSFSCEKLDSFNTDKEDNYEFPCEVGECDKCPDNQLFDETMIEHNLDKIVVRPLIFSEDCGCYVSGLIKYTDCGMTVAIISYGNGECDGIAIKTLCVNGDCSDEKAVTCEFELVEDCEFN